MQRSTIHFNLYVRPSNQPDDAVPVLRDGNQADTFGRSILQFELIFLADIQTDDFLVRILFDELIKCLLSSSRSRLNTETN